MKIVRDGETTPLPSRERERERERERCTLHVMMVNGGDGASSLRGAIVPPRFFKIT